MVWGPAVAAWQLGAAWLVDRWSSWEWLREVAPGLSWVVCAAVLLWGIGSLALITRRGYWVPFEGRGRWTDVVARDGLLVTKRVGRPYGGLDVVSFERVTGARINALLDRLLPSPLPGLAACEPHPDWLQSTEQWVDKVVARVADRVAVPRASRCVIPPDDEFADNGLFARHLLRVTFDAAANGRQVELLIHSENGFPVVQVDGLFACLGEHDEFDEDLDSMPAAEETADLLAALFGEGRQEPVAAWRLTSDDDRSWDFYPQPTFSRD